MTSSPAPNRVLALLAALVLLLAAVAVHAREYNPHADRPATTPGTDRVIVKWHAASTANAAKPAVVGATAEQRLADLGWRAGVKLRGLRRLGAGLEVVRLDAAAPGDSMASMLERLRADPAVEYAEPDARVRPHRVPSDPGFAGQWFPQPTLPATGGSTASAVDAEAAWDVTLGSPAVVVAVIDTGVRFDHPDLRPVADGGKLLPGYDFVGTDADGSASTANDGDGWDPDASDPGDWISSQDRQKSRFADCPVDKSSWHGTRVSGMVAALTDNGAGIAGLGWDTRVLPVRALGKCGGYTSDIITAMRWAAGLEVPGAPLNPTPARVLNLSLGGEGDCTAAYQQAIDEVTARGVTVVVSAGNDGSLVDRPANCRGVVSVTGVRHVGTKVGFANLGPDVTIAAPGGNCVNVGPGDACLYSLDTTTNFGTTTPGANGYTDRLDHINVGTSFAAPLVAGIAALMYSVNGDLTSAAVTSRLRSSASPFPVSSDPSVPTCHVPSGANDLQVSECSCTTSTCGAGLANAPRAVEAALQPLAVVSGPTQATSGQTVELSGSGSLGANERTIVAYAWSIVSGDAALTALAGSQTSFVAPGTAGNVVVRLSVTDDAGRTDSTDATIAINGGAPPPTPPPSPGGTPSSGESRSGGGGGGLLDAWILVLLAALASSSRRLRASVETIRLRRHSR